MALCTHLVCMRPQVQFPNYDSQTDRHTHTPRVCELSLKRFSRYFGLEVD